MKQPDREVKLEHEVAAIMEHRQFFGQDEDRSSTLDGDEIVLDVIILARVKRPEDVGTSTSGLIILTDEGMDDIMVDGMLHRAVLIQDDDRWRPMEDEDE